MSYRRTIYLNDGEASALLARADALGTPANTLVRLSVRLVCGLPVPAWAREELAKATDEQRRT